MQCNILPTRRRPPRFGQTPLSFTLSNEDVLKISFAPQGNTKHDRSLTDVCEPSNDHLATRQALRLEIQAVRGRA
jgi:hypothetical protein